MTVRTSASVEVLRSKVHGIGVFARYALNPGDSVPVPSDSHGFNHSCDANVANLVVRDDARDTRGRVLVVQKIRKGAELFLDYRTFFFSTGIECPFRGCPSCRDERSRVARVKVSLAFAGRT